MKIPALAFALILAAFVCSVGDVAANDGANDSANDGANEAANASGLVEFQTLVAAIHGETGEVDILRVVPVLRLRNLADGAAIRRNRLSLERAMRLRLRSVSSRELIPPRGDTAWLEQELQKIAEQVLAPIRLEDLFFRELTID